MTSTGYQVWQRHTGGNKAAHLFVDGRGVCGYSGMKGSGWEPVKQLAISGRPYGQVCSVCWMRSMRKDDSDATMRGAPKQAVALVSLLTAARRVVEGDYEHRCLSCCHCVEVCDCGLAKLRNAVREYDEISAKVMIGATRTGSTAK